MILNGLYTLAFSLTNKLFFLFFAKIKTHELAKLSIINCQLSIKYCGHDVQGQSGQTRFLIP